MEIERCALITVWMTHDGESDLAGIRVQQKAYVKIQGSWTLNLHGGPVITMVFDRVPFHRLLHEDIIHCANHYLLSRPSFGKHFKKSTRI